MYWISLLENNYVLGNVHRITITLQIIFLMVLSATCSLGPHTSVLPPLRHTTFPRATSFAAPFVDKFTEHKHLLTANVPGVSQSQSHTNHTEGDHIKQEVVLLEHGCWLLLSVPFWGLCVRSLVSFLQRGWSGSPYSLHLLASLLCGAPSAQPTHQSSRSIPSLPEVCPPGKLHSLAAL